MLPPPSEVRARWAEGHPELDTSPMEVVALLKRINALLGLALEPLYQGGRLTVPEVDLLITLRHARTPVIARHLADHHGLSRAAVSKTLAKLESRGHIVREPSPNDGRAALVTITPEGAAAIDDFFPHQLRIEAELLARLGGERAHVLRSLGLLARTLEEGVSGTARPGSGDFA